jgi:hypothetical protein
MREIDLYKHALFYLLILNNSLDSIEYYLTCAQPREFWCGEE